MQIVKLQLSHNNFYCPVTGAQLIDDTSEYDDSLPSLMGSWCSEVIEDPRLNDANLLKAWTEFVDSHDFDEDFDFDDDPVEIFLEGYPADNWVAFKVTYSGWACGPMSQDIYSVFDMDYKEED